MCCICGGNNIESNTRKIRTRIYWNNKIHTTSTSIIFQFIYLFSVSQYFFFCNFYLWKITSQNFMWSSEINYYVDSLEFTDLRCFFFILTFKPMQFPANISSISFQTHFHQSQTKLSPVKDKESEPDSGFNLNLQFLWVVLTLFRNVSSQTYQLSPSSRVPLL